MRILSHVIIGIVALLCLPAIARAQEPQESILKDIHPSNYVDRGSEIAPASHERPPINPVRWPSSAPSVWGPFAWGPHYGLGWSGWAGWSGSGPLYQQAMIVGRMKVNLDHPAKSAIVWGDITKKQRSAGR